jgi:adenylate kinase family enzyme
MLLAIIGENCVGKSTLAKEIEERIGGSVYSGKDYLRLEKNPQTAAETFKNLLENAVFGENVIYLITEKEHLTLLPNGAFKIVLTADIQTIKERFRERMRGNLPVPVEKMLENKHGMYDDLDCDLRLDNSYDIDEVVTRIKEI